MIEQRYNTFWPRFWAGWIDALVFIPIYFLDSWIFSHDFIGLINFLYYALVSSLGFYFYSVFMHGRYGQTLGKMAMEIRVYSVDGKHLGYQKAIFRDSIIIVVAVLLLIIEAPEIISGVNPYEAAADNQIFYYLMYAELLWFVAEFLTMLTNEKRRAIHDFIAGSVVQRL
jgi:uncharacterized RDD family membrane protein YckC